MLLYDILWVVIHVSDIKRNLAFAKQIAQTIEHNGGRAYLVGGYVRDSLLGKVNTDIDIEVHGIAADRLFEILQTMGEVMTYGKSFGIFAVKGYDVDIALPRTEKCVGKSHRDFEIHSDPYMGIEEAASRRDFTVNALMQDILSGEIVDCFGGKDDLKRGVIRHVNDKHFGEDPLRVLRGAQFAARFNFDTDEKTLDIYRKTDLAALSPERVAAELYKALLLADKPSVFFETLRRADRLLPWFAELKDLIGIEQNPVYHAEGDVWTHTMMVLDEAAALRDKVQNPLGFMLCALCHDFGKKVATVTIDGVIHAYNHETKGLPIAERFIKRLTNETKLRKYVLNLISLHMKPRVLAAAGSSVKATNKMFDAALCPMDLIYMSEADSRGKLPRREDSSAFKFLTERYETYKEIMSRPYVTGEDLVKSGLSPDKNFKKILEYAHKLRLAGVQKEEALKQALAYAGK